VQTSKRNQDDQSKNNLFCIAFWKTNQMNCTKIRDDIEYANHR